MKRLIGLLLLLGASAASAAPFSTGRPSCRQNAASPLPASYASFDWTRMIRPGDTHVRHDDDPEVNPSGGKKRLRYDLYRLDLDGDGWCDWLSLIDEYRYVPGFSRGYSDTVTVVYLWRDTAWKRYGPSVDENQNDGAVLKQGRSVSWEYRRINASIGVLQSKEGPVYLLTSGTRSGHSVFRWSEADGALVELDKWRDGSDARAVYEFFKRNGAYGLQDDQPLRFDPAKENEEIADICNGTDTIPPTLRSPCWNQLQPTSEKLEDVVLRLFDWTNRAEREDQMQQANIAPVKNAPTPSWLLVEPYAIAPRMRLIQSRQGEMPTIIAEGRFLEDESGVEHTGSVEWLDLHNGEYVLGVYGGQSFSRAGGGFDYTIVSYVRMRSGALTPIVDIPVKGSSLDVSYDSNCSASSQSKAHREYGPMRSGWPEIRVVERLQSWNYTCAEGDDDRPPDEDVTRETLYQWSGSRYETINDEE